MTCKKTYDPYLNPQCNADFIDLYVIRSGILRALRQTAPDFHGLMLDVGCGYMPYRKEILATNCSITQYIGLDLPNSVYENKPDLLWDGVTIPLESNYVDCVMATEVLEHCAEPEQVIREVFRVLKPGGLLFLTTPFMWPLHNVPDDHYRYTPYAMNRILGHAGFCTVRVAALGGWDASLAQMIGLWVRRRVPAGFWREFFALAVLPLVRWLAFRDQNQVAFGESVMFTSLGAWGRKPTEGGLTNVFQKNSI